MARPRKNGRLPSPPIMVVDVSLYRSFCFRGEGRANIVISAKHRHTNNRIVWRFAKTRKSGELSLKTKSMVVGEFMETMVSPLLHSNYLVKPRTVEMRVEDVHQLAKIPKLEANNKVEDISELESVCSSISLLPLSSVPQGVTTITCLEMLDATCIPKRFIALSDHSTITMEIKPKQGYYQNHPGIDIPYCNNCILQMEKCVGKGSTFTSMYDFCPLALFSTQVREQREALESLIRDPHRNLRIFLDGKTVHSNETFLQRDELQRILYPEDDCCLDDLLEGVLSVLNGSKEGGSGDGRDSLLQQLLKGQKMDELGIVKAHQLFFTLSQKEQAEVGRKVQSQGGLSFLQDQSPVSLLKRFFLAATLKDCSIMISLRLIKNDSDLQEETDLIRLPSNKTFAYSVKLDFDCSSWNGPMTKLISFLRKLDRVVNQSRRQMTSPLFVPKTEFRPSKVLIVAKTTRYQMEKRLASSVDDETLHSILVNRGTDYNRLLSKHNEHKAYVKYLEQLLKNRDCETRIVERFDYDESAADWADAIFAAGGDGTFLLASSKIQTNEKPVIGINTDPQGSEGHMCLLRKAPMEHVDGAIDRLFKGDFQWLFRTRIRISVTSEGGLGESTPLHSSAMNREPSTTRWEGRGRERDRERSSPRKPSRVVGERRTEDVPILSLNEVFLGESLSSRVSYFQLSIDGGPLHKQKNSGLTVCTGSGSTSWYFNINKLTRESVADVLSLASSSSSSFPSISPSDQIIDKICNQFNEKLMFDPDLNKMAFCIRDPIFNSTFTQSKSRGFATDIKVCSRGYDSHLVVDGGMSYPFNDGSEAHLRVLPQDSLRTVIFR